MSCYFAAQIKIHDPQEYRRYLDGFDQVFVNYDGQVVAVDDGPVILEGEWPYTRAVVIRFPDEDEARRWYESPEYQRLAVHRVNASDADVILVHGRD
jgi:uncharacterized protein (DUF1330 family)